MTTELNQAKESYVVLSEESRWIEKQTREHCEEEANERLKEVSLCIGGFFYILLNVLFYVFYHILLYIFLDILKPYLVQFTFYFINLKVI